MQKIDAFITAQDFLARGVAIHRSRSTERVILLDGDIGQLSPEQEAAICDFVEKGGGLVCVGDATEAYHEYPLLGDLLGNVHGFCTPRSEVIARVANPHHYLTRRVDPSFPVLEGVYLLDSIVPNAEVLWRASWR